MPAGIVLTGGTSRMEGVVELAEEIFHMPVRVGYPQSIAGLKDILRNPIYSTGVGLLHYGAENLDNYRSSLNTPAGMFRHFYRLKNWLQENF